MRFYTRQHKHYCGIDLHARTMHLCVLDQAGEVLVDQNIRCEPKVFLRTIAPYRDDLVVAVECIFTLYWLADLCAREQIPFVLGHALYMKAIHGGKAKYDRIDAHKIATLLRAGMLPEAYVYPPEMRATRDLFRRRLHIVRTVKEHDPDSFLRLRSLPGVGKILALTIRSEIHDIHRFPSVQDFASYARLVTCAQASAGKRLGTDGRKIGNAHRTWAFSEAGVLFLRQNPKGQGLFKKLQRKHGKGKALSILAHTLGRATYPRLDRSTAFNMEKFMAA
jgi:transposase